MSNNLPPLRSLGQNFLTDKNIIRKIVNASAICKTDTVVEIGPGKGILTFELVKQAKKVIAIEKDKGLFGILQNEIHDRQIENIDLIHADALKFCYNSIGPFVVVANPPYDIASRLIIDLLSQVPNAKKIIFVVQKEVAKKAIAKSGDMVLFSVLVQTFGNPEILFNIPRSCFHPQPHVDSSILRITRNTQNFSSKTEHGTVEYDTKRFIQIVKAGFSSKRKFLINNLSEKLEIDKDELKKIFSEIGLDEKVRAERLSIKQWLCIFRKLGND